ncbi:SpaH/EbpB family LPXTG-anchored major pilin [Nocardioides nitrophenolicus]|uniref:SpaH/EbpB family LPXTG-anchored major pilin n=1 Tax=Nocardioides nitrophenolicus TaxID=60489 RepID=UPI0019585005|nr:SpaH/EbpB family LPXTG-anchored major pilin [Nocardioides nitrophenolicus]MBM7518721.1 fimbrial isopeptide formation D2 family protein/LPXTG-motif cell wall-anchored protein [Nocardioides nitrophenolicus]
MPTSLRRALSAVLLALLGIGATGLGGFGTAQAAPVVDIDPDATASLHLHKFEQPDDFGPPANGLETDMTGQKPIAGVEFTVQRVSGIDLTTNAGWREAAALTEEQAAARAETPGRTGTTDAAGDVDFTDLPLGLYLVTETSYPAGVTPSKPFLVTLPLTHPTDRDTWLYDVHVYPKNAVTGATKTVEDSDSVKLGDDVRWTITADIPRVAEIDLYRIVDRLDERLDYRSATVRLTNDAALTEGTDYTITHDAATNTVTVEFTAAGREILAANAPDAQVEVVLTTTANATGTITNEAIVYPNEASTEHQPGEPGGPVVTPPVDSRWGVIVIEKVADSSSGGAALAAGNPLAGAEFQVYASEADARAQRDPIVIDGVDTWTTGADGRAVISGLRYSSYADGRALEIGDPDYRSYWLVETKAPDGFELLAEPVQVDVTSADPATVSITIENVPHNAGFDLPLTGGAGTTLITVLGLLLLAGGVLFAVLRGRRRTHAEA